MKRSETMVTGTKYGRLTLVSETERVSSHDRWICQCECGVIKNIAGSALRRGATVSCGCYRNEKSKQTPVTHGHSRRGQWHPLYRVWAAMKRRCSNPVDSSYERYGGRGIMVCERWRLSFENFLADMGERPEGMTIDRRDNSGNYEPSNCRWATPSQQAFNRRPKPLTKVTYVPGASGGDMNYDEAALFIGIPLSALRGRVHQRTVPHVRLGPHKVKFVKSELETYRGRI